MDSKVTDERRIEPNVCIVSGSVCDMRYINYSRYFPGDTEMAQENYGEIEPLKANVSWNVIKRPATSSEFSSQTVLDMVLKINNSN